VREYIKREQRQNVLRILPRDAMYDNMIVTFQTVRSGVCWKIRFLSKIFK
jgi:hypothetical protein